MKLPRKIKKRIPKNTPYCYSRFTCKYYKHIEGVEGYCKLIKYDELAQMLEDINKVGWTFEYYLDAEPYNLKPIQ